MLIVGKKLIIFSIALAFLVAFCAVFVHAQTVSDTPTPATAVDTSKQRDELNKRILELEGKVSSLHKQADSLSSQIQVMDSQIKLTEYRMNATQQEITDLSLDIDSATK